MLGIVQAPAHYGGTWWAVCLAPTCYWMRQATTWDEAAAHLSAHTAEHQTGETTHAP